ncbi:hypothetical protein PC128_g24777 [Phytophthora cactorum]|nr:hypothetical protein PC128_g24777 [Phytophthora cactorum]
MQPLVCSSAKLSVSSNPVVELKFHNRAAQRCWFSIICARVPIPIGGHSVAPCIVEGIIAFANLRDHNHPFQAHIHLMRDRARIFDSVVIDIAMPISRQPPLTLRYFHLWRILRGQTDAFTLTIALWDHHHWVSNLPVERMTRAMFRNLSFDKEVAKVILRHWKEYVKSRKQWVDVLWIHHKRNFQGEWLVDEEAKPEEQKELPPELVFESSTPLMSLENLPWEPTSVVWNASVMTLDAAEPWCNCWLQKPHLYSFNTTFLPCNPTARIFVPHGHTPQSVGPRIVIDGSVSTWEVVIG